MNQHFRAVPGIPNPRSPLAPNKNGANYELARGGNVLVSVPRELLKPLGQFGAKDGRDPSAPGPARGCWATWGDRAGGTQSWENAEPRAPRTRGRAGDTQNLGSHQGSAARGIPAGGIWGSAASPGRAAAAHASLAGCEGHSGCPGAQSPCPAWPFGGPGAPWATRSSQGWPRAAPCGQPQAGTRLSSAGRGARCGFTALPGTNGFKLP